jgi:type I restriction enzyme, S subunit
MEVRLGGICSIIMGQAPPGSACNKHGNGVPLVKAGEFGDRRPVIREWTTTPLKMARADDVLVCVVGATAGKVNQGADCAIGRSVAAIRPDAREVLSDYLYRVMSTQVGRLRSGSQGLAQGVITREMLADLRVAVPPLDEQRRLAAILDQADALRAKCRHALAHLAALNQSIFLDMFGDRRAIMAKWPTKSLGELLQFLTSGSRGWAKYYSDSGQPFLRIQNVRRDALVLDDIALVDAPDTAEAKRTTVKPGDVLLSITADLGRTAVVPADLGTAFINQHLSILRTSSVAPEYLSTFLASEAGQAQILGRNRQGVKAGLNFDDIRSLEIPLPPRELQEEFVNLVHSIRKQRDAMTDMAARSEDLFRSIQARAFVGQL